MSERETLSPHNHDVAVALGERHLGRRTAETKATGVPAIGKVVWLDSEFNFETTSEIQVATLTVNLRQSTGVGRGRSIFDDAPSPNIGTKLDVIHARQL
ncbi:uncharacterized protein METZ01_LOCUS96233 [marine metagenome]|uniref:Uncharacterized protein n=1 Tax=marine metagenome TaxID=408172 RepID=A0A381VSX2_9ZZZZ